MRAHLTQSPGAWCSGQPADLPLLGGIEGRTSMGVRARSEAAMWPRSAPSPSGGTHTQAARRGRWHAHISLRGARRLKRSVCAACGVQGYGQAPRSAASVAIRSSEFQAPLASVPERPPLIAQGRSTGWAWR